MGKYPTRVNHVFCSDIFWDLLHSVRSAAGNHRPKPAAAPGHPLAVRQVRSGRLFRHRVRLHGGDVPHSDQEPGRGLLLPGGQDRRHPLPPAGPAEGLLAARPGFHHGGGGNLRWGPRNILPGDSRGETS